MTNQEAIKVLKEQIEIKNDERLEAILKAVKSLEAWDNVIRELEIGGYEDVLEIIDRYISDGISAEGDEVNDCISRQAVLDVWHTSYSDNREENEEIQYKKIAFELPSVTPTERTGHEETIKIIDKTLEDCFECEGGEGWLRIDGEEYTTDVGYALEGMEIFAKVLKKRLAEKTGDTDI